MPRGRDEHRETTDRAPLHSTRERNGKTCELLLRPPRPGLNGIMTQQPPDSDPSTRDDNASNVPDVSRRVWLGSAATTAACSLVVVGGCTSAPRWETADVKATGDILELELARYPVLATPGGMLAMTVNGKGKPLLVMRLENDQFRAMSLRCPHLGCTVRWDNATQQLICPCHRSIFDDTGRRLSGPAKTSLQQYTAQLLAEDTGSIRVQVQLT